MNTRTERIIACLLCICMLLTGSMFIGTPATTVAYAESAVAITRQPSDVRVAEGAAAKVSFTAEGEDLTYTWYFKEANGTQFYKTSSFTSNYYNTTMNAARNGRQIYCIVTDKYGNTAKTNTVTISMCKTASITTQPVSVTVASGKTAKVSLTAAGDDLTYEWYFKNAGASKFSKTSAFTGNSYAVAMDSTRDGRQLYCVVTDKYGNSVTSNTVTISMEHYAEITRQPVSVSAYSGSSAKVSFTATGDGLTYTWYFKDAGSEKFSKTSSFTTNVYNTIMTDARNGRQIYCVVTDKYGKSVQTNTVTLSMRYAAAITVQPVSVTVANGKTAKVSLTATGDGLTYEWYFKNAGASKFSKTAAFTGNSYAVAMDSTRDGRQLYCVITDKYGNSVTTDTVTISMEHYAAITTQPENAAAAEGKNVKVTFTASGDGLTYTWYFKEANGTKFYKTASFTSNYYSTTMTDARNGRQIYCVVTDKYGNTATTDTVTLTMADPVYVSITKQPVSVSVKSGETAKVTVEAIGDGLTYTWYYKNAGATAFTKTTAFKGSTYSVEMNSSRAGRQVYCVVADEYGNAEKSATVTIGMSDKITLGEYPTEVKAIESTTAKVTIPATGNGLTYKWYFKDAGASKFSYTSTFKSNTYSTTMNEARDGRQIYCVITDKDGNFVQTETITLAMAQPVRITTQPEDVSAANGKTAKVTVVAEGDGLTYAWYYKNAGSDSFVLTTSFTGNTYSVSMSSDRNGRQVYCVVTDAYGSTDISRTATLSLESDPDDFTYTVSDGNATITGYNGIDTNVTIPSKLNGYPVTAIGSYAFDGSNIVYINLPSTVTSIGQYAFRDCDQLQTFSFPKSLKTIGYGAFYDCYDLNNIIIPGNVTTIGDHAFNSCNSLCYITICNGVSTIGSHAFEDCGPYSVNSEITIRIPGSVSTIGSYAFYDCSFIHHVVIEEGVKIIGASAFESCTHLATVVFPDGLQIIGTNAFWGCDALSYIDIPTTVTMIGELAFAGCDSLTSVTVPGNVKTIGSQAFAHNDGLYTVIVEEGVTTINYSAFAMCSMLTYVSLPSSLTNIGNFIFYESSAVTVGVPAGSDAYYYCVSNGYNYIIE